MSLGSRTPSVATTAGAEMGFVTVVVEVTVEASKADVVTGPSIGAVETGVVTIESVV